MSHQLGSEKWPAWYKWFHAHEPKWLFSILTWFWLLVAWLISAVSCRQWLPYPKRFVTATGVRPSDLPDDRPVMIVSTHRTLVDSFILGSVLCSIWTALLRVRLMIWNVPEMDNYQFNWWLDFFIRHLHCIPVHRGDPHQGMVFQRNLNKAFKALRRVVIFAGGGRERYYQLLKVSDEMAHALLIALRRRPETVLLVVRMDGIPVWDGKPMSGSDWEKFKQLAQAVTKQTQGRDIVVHLEYLDTAYWIKQPDSKKLHREFAEAIRTRIKPLYPPNPFEEEKELELTKE